MAGRGFDEGLGSADDSGGMTGEDPATVARDRTGETGDVAERVQTCLAGEAETASGVEGGEGGPVDECHVETGAGGRVPLAYEISGVVPGGCEQIAIDAGEVAVDLLTPDDRLDLGDSLMMALCDQGCARDAMQSFEVDVAFVEERREMRRRPRGLAATDRTIVEDDDGTALALQKIGGGEARDAGADDTDVGAHVVLQRLEWWHFRRRHPERPSAVAMVGGGRHGRAGCCRKYHGGKRKQRACRRQLQPAREVGGSRGGADRGFGTRIPDSLANLLDRAIRTSSLPLAPRAAGQKTPGVRTGWGSGARRSRN